MPRAAFKPEYHGHSDEKSTLLMKHICVCSRQSKCCPFTPSFAFWTRNMQWRQMCLNCPAQCSQRLCAPALSLEEPRLHLYKLSCEKCVHGGAAATPESQHA
eukprot:1159130-Pelagomonas_calceolata.AAC.11